MSDFSRTEWSSAIKAEYFMDHASRFIPERFRMLGVVASLLRQVIAPRFRGRRLSEVELGCGDGALSWALRLCCPDITLTLLDGSADMLDGARRRFGDTAGVKFVQATFQHLISGHALLPQSHLVVSSLAIHHLRLDEKRRLFAVAANALVPGGAFANIDVVLSPTSALEDWYLQLWADWIGQNDAEARDGKSFGHIPTGYKRSPDNLPDTLQDQLSALRDCGLDGVDVFFKSGVFAVFGGFKPIG
jgi:tRNA (cmo5U34)-methyltransferase